MSTGVETVVLGPASVQDALGSLYNTVVLDLFEHPHNAGRLPPGPNIIEAESGRREDGAQVRFSGSVVDGRIKEIRFQAYGCPQTLAVCEWLAGKLPGRPWADPGLGGALDWVRAMQLPADRLTRLLVIEDALRAALSAAQRQAPPG